MPSSATYPSTFQLDPQLDEASLIVLSSLDQILHWVHRFFPLCKLLCPWGLYPSTELTALSLRRSV